MRLLLFRVLSPLLIILFPDKARRGYLRRFHEQQAYLLQRDRESLAATRPRSESRTGSEHMEQ
jgi:hypothetical protein